MARFKLLNSLVGKVIGDENLSIEIRENNAAQIEQHMGNAIVAALEEIGLAAERFAKRACPVDTGRLRNSITHALNAAAQEVYIGTNVEYAPYVELGTSRRKGVHFLLNAAQGHASFYRSVLKRHLENA